MPTCKTREKETPRTSIFWGSRIAAEPVNTALCPLEGYTARTVGAKRQEVKQLLRARMHETISNVGEWFGRVLNGASSRLT